MRALEVTLFAIAVLAAPTMFSAMGFFPIQYGTCDATVCQVQGFLYGMANQSTLQPLNLNSTNPQNVAWDTITFAVTFVVFAAFWMLYILSLVTIIAPALVTQFGVPPAFANYINIFYWLLWMLALIQYKRGGLSIDSLK